MTPIRDLLQRTFEMICLAETYHQPEHVWDEMHSVKWAIFEHLNDTHADGDAAP